MTEETARLTLAFVGEQEVHRNNARSLLEDFVEGWLKQHRKGEVKVVFADVDGAWTDTFKDIEDWAGTSGFEIGSSSPGQVVKLLLEESDARLILVGDPNDDDSLYDVVEEAAKYRIQTRSLINGLEKVVFDDDELDDDMAGDGFHEVDVESGEGWAQDDDLTDEAAALLAAVPDVPDAPEADASPDLDLLAALADDGTVEAQEEIKDIAAAVDIDVAPFETWVDAVAALRAVTDWRPGPASSQTEVDPEYVPDPPDEEPAVVVIADGPVELTESDLKEALERLDVSAPEDEYFDIDKTPYTREQLEAMSFDEIKAVALDHGIPPGRGMKHGVFVNKILLATGVETEPVKRKRGKKPKEEVVLSSVTAASPEEGVAQAEGATITPISTMTGHSLAAIASRLQEIVEELQSLI